MRPSNAQQPAVPRAYFLWAALLATVVVFAGFGRSYYLRPLFGLPPLSAFLHIHGFVMTAWIGLFCVQVGLVTTHRVRWHRQLGLLGIACATLVIVLGSAATLRAAAREVSAHAADASMRITVLGLELTQMLLFAVLIGLAFGLRRRGEYHKRLMLLATACILPNAISRLPISLQSNLAILLIFDALVCAAVVVDTARRRRLHPAFGWGGVFVLAALHGAYVVAYSSRWHGLATWLVSLMT